MDDPRYHGDIEIAGQHEGFIAVFSGKSGASATAGALACEAEFLFQNPSDRHRRHGFDAEGQFEVQAGLCAFDIFPEALNHADLLRIDLIHGGVDAQHDDQQHEDDRPPGDFDFLQIFYDLVHLGRCGAAALLLLFKFFPVPTHFFSYLIRVAYYLPLNDSGRM